MTTSALLPDRRHLVDLWQALIRTLDAWSSDWRLRVGFDAGPPKRALPSRSPSISNREAFEALTLALLSGNTRWDRIEAVQSELKGPFKDFDPVQFATVDDSSIEAIVRWFRGRRAGAARLNSSLKNLRRTAAVLTSDGYNSADAMFSAALQCADGSPERVAMLFGTSPTWKLPGFGVPLAAEALRNLGFDLSKPDRHVLRAIASWSLIEFVRWNQRGAFTAPTASPPQLYASMCAVRHIAEANGVPVTRASSAIWIAGAISGARLTNEQLAAMAPTFGRIDAL